MPDTILSRCQQLDFRPVGIDLIRERLEKIAEAEGFSLTTSAAAAIAGAAEGSVRDALSLLDQLRAFTADAVDDEAVATVLGVPPLEVTTRLIEVLAAGETAAGLGLLRERLAGGQDASILFQEMGRTLRTLMYLALDPALVPTLTEPQIERLQPVAQTYGADALSRMLGLWVEHDHLVKEAGNRELALEVAAMRLARWPAVRQLETWLAGGETPPPAGGSGPGRTSTPGAGGGAGPSPAKPPASRSAAAETPVAKAADSDEAAIECESEQKNERETAPEPAADEDLTTIAGADPGVILATRILGGEVVAVRPDGEGT